MLWYKAWLDTRWPFLIGLAILVVLACGNVFEYPTTARLLPLADTLPHGTGIVGRAIDEAIQTQRDYRGFIWWQWVRQNFTQTWTLFAVLLGSGGLLVSGSKGALFTAALPASRKQLLGIRAGACMIELLVLAVVPSLLIWLLSPAVGESYSLTTALVHASCMFLAGVVFYSFAVLMSTTFHDMWRPALVTCLVAIGIGVVETVVRQMGGYGVFAVMRAETYFRSGALPWGGLLVTIAISASLFYAALLNFVQLDL